MWVLIFLFFFFTLCKVFIIQSLPPEGRSHSLLCGCDWQLKYRKTQVQNYGASFSKGKSSWDLLQWTWNRGRFYTVSAVFQKCKQQNTVLNKIAAPPFQWNLALNNSTWYWQVFCFLVKIWLFSYQILAFCNSNVQFISFGFVFNTTWVGDWCGFAIYFILIFFIFNFDFKLLILLDCPDVLFMTKATEYGEV